MCESHIWARGPEVVYVHKYIYIYTGRYPHIYLYILACVCVHVFELFGGHGMLAKEVEDDEEEHAEEGVELHCRPPSPKNEVS